MLPSRFPFPGRSCQLQSIRTIKWVLLCKLKRLVWHTWFTQMINYDIIRNMYINVIVFYIEYATKLYIFISTLSMKYAIMLYIYIFRQTSDISRTLVDHKIVDHSDVVGASSYITFFAIYTQKGWARTWASLCVPISKHLTLGHPQAQCKLHISKIIVLSHILNVTSLLIRWYFSTWLTDEILINLAPSRVLGPMGKKSIKI